ncbi:MAG: response regulator [Magnetococcales bacterium]|nr:response regulator [Magnetococcales bacterium]
MDIDSDGAKRLVAFSIHQALVGVRILTADPNPTGRTIVAEILHGFGATVGEAEDPTVLLVALEQASGQKRPWDMLLLDHRFIEQYGSELAGLKGHPGWGGKVGVMVPSNVRLADLAVVGEFADVVSILKPLKRLSLLRTLKALLEGRLVEVEQEYDGLPVEDTDIAPLRILLVEDQEENRQLATIILEKAGHTVLQVKDGVEALNRITDGAVVDLMLIDLQMPNMDGYELTRRVREGNTVNAQAPIVAVTARALPGEKALCLASGMDEFLVKPYRPVELLNVTVRATLTRRFQQKTIEAKEAPPLLKPFGDVVLFQEAGSLLLRGPELFLAVLKGALEEKNAKRAREQTEEIKKKALAIGAERVKIKAVRLGVAVRAEEWLKANKLFKELEAECVEVYHALLERMPNGIEIKRDAET